MHFYNHYQVQKQRALTYYSMKTVGIEFDFNSTSFDRAFYGRRMSNPEKHHQLCSLEAKIKKQLLNHTASKRC